jgi:hypothetical protein
MKVKNYFYKEDVGQWIFEKTLASIVRHMSATLKEISQQEAEILQLFGTRMEDALGPPFWTNGLNCFG